MFRLLSTIILILSIVLFPPAVLAFVSNNAVPGDATYPIKRSLENVILAVVSVNPTSKAWFSTTRSDRRYKEFASLVTQGKKTTETLSELVDQTDLAVSQISQVTNKEEKAKLIEQYSQTIERYDAGLQEISNTSYIAEVPDQSESASVVNEPPVSAPTTVPTFAPTSPPVSAKAGSVIVFTPKPSATPTLAPLSSSTPKTHSSCSCSSDFDSKHNFHPNAGSSCFKSF